MGQWVKTVDESEDLRTEAVSQSRGPTCHISVPPARGHEDEMTVLGVDGVFDDDAGCSVESLVIDVL